MKHQQHQQSQQQEQIKSTYEKAEEWCKRIIRNGDDLLFFADTFDTEMMKASLELQFPFEVRVGILFNFKVLNS